MGLGRQDYFLFSFLPASLIYLSIYFTIRPSSLALIDGLSNSNIEDAVDQVLPIPQSPCPALARTSDDGKVIAADKKDDDMVDPLEKNDATEIKEKVPSPSSIVISGEGQGYVGWAILPTLAASRMLGADDASPFQIADVHSIFDRLSRMRVVPERCAGYPVQLQEMLGLISSIRAHKMTLDPDLALACLRCHMLCSAQDPGTWPWLEVDTLVAQLLTIGREEGNLWPLEVKAELIAVRLSRFILTCNNLSEVQAFRSSVPSDVSSVNCDLCCVLAKPIPVVFLIYFYCFTYGTLHLFHNRCCYQARWCL